MNKKGVLREATKVVVLAYFKPLILNLFWRVIGHVYFDRSQNLKTHPVAL